MSIFHRWQVALTGEQRVRLEERGRREGRPVPDLVREAVDIYLVADVADPTRVLDASFGSLPDLRVPGRGEWDG
jgi:hypothetical protein